MHKLKPGDFTGLAGDYSKHRPDYSRSVLNALLGIFDKPHSQLDVADVGAGTGIWSRMVYSAGVHSVVAIEPNGDMRNNGISDSIGLNIHWMQGCAESTGLEDRSVDWLTMASSFHWADFELATKEFYRVLKPGGRFTAVWNPRLIEINPILVEIEQQLKALQPDIRRVSSGRSGITESLTEQLWASPLFEDVVYVEGRHSIKMPKERYLGAWRSVNDLRVQLGVEKFDAFMEFVEKRIQYEPEIEAVYLTRAWSARRVDG
jgi:ubiquinone/menaquinone biosynthesis C-methylase UbiE